MHHLSLLSVSCTYQGGLKKFYFYSVLILIMSMAILAPFTDSLLPLCLQTYTLYNFTARKPLWCYLFAELNVNVIWYYTCASTHSSNLITTLDVLQALPK